jgi:uncharacterized membrane protein SpoIIM required for sporulation
VSGPILRSARFRRERERHWRELDGIVTRVGTRGVRTLVPAEAARLPSLYRTALASLSVARSISLDRNVVDYLTSLCTRAFFVVYGTRHRFAESLLTFFGRHFPATLRRLRLQAAIAAGLLLLGVVAGFAVTHHDPERYWSFVDPAMAAGRTPWTSTEELRATLYGREDDHELLLAFASFLFSHNAQVCFLCFALGAAFGLPVAWLLFANGATLGAMAEAFHAHGLGADWWGWILPHGITELLAVVLSGAAGLLLGQSIAFPGRRRRLDELALRGRDAGTLVLAAVALLFFAALIEGLARQLVPEIRTRYALAGATALFWCVYLGFAGRGRERDAA